jgi:hypothetical protein
VFSAESGTGLKGVKEVNEVKEVKVLGLCILQN